MSAHRDPTNPDWVLARIINGNAGYVALAGDYRYRLDGGSGADCDTAVYRLHDDGYVTLDPDGGVTATRAGRAAHRQTRQASAPAPSTPAVVFQPAAA